jgi:hypothetical protein
MIKLSPVRKLIFYNIYVVTELSIKEFLNYDSTTWCFFVNKIQNNVWIKCQFLKWYEFFYLNGIAWKV